MLMDDETLEQRIKDANLVFTYMYLVQHAPEPVAESELLKVWEQIEHVIRDGNSKMLTQLKTDGFDNGIRKVDTDDPASDIFGNM